MRHFPAFIAGVVVAAALAIGLQLVAADETDWPTYGHGGKNCDTHREDAGYEGDPFPDPNRDCIFNGIDQGILAAYITHPHDILTYTPTHTPTATHTPQARNKYEWPFASNSVWNQPIGANATLTAANLGTPQCFETACRYFTEVEYIFLTPNAPLEDFKPENGGGCSSTVTDGQVRLPAGVTFGGTGGNNDTGGALRSDNDTVQEWYNGCRTDGNGPVYAWGSACEHSLTGNGIPGGCGHGGSQLSAVGGSIREWELATGVPIRHALKLTMPANRLSNDGVAPCNGNGSRVGYRWPAVWSDDGYNTPGGDSEYSGSVQNLCMGALLALPQSYNCTNQSELADRVCAALRDFGAYIVDIHPKTCAGCWHPFTLNGEPAVADAIGDDTTSDNEMITLISALQVVSNNSSSTIGGGGAPVVPTAPALP